ncbi:MAG: DUF3795 domain-containing protein [Chloroflexi bacterium]|nr:DUF3795 domain-containing protein [Chloroflexota bacterium]
MKMPEVIENSMIAPCGMNCMVCYVHLKDKKPCLGCLAGDLNKPAHCRACKIKACAAEKEVPYCFECSAFPCGVIKRLDQSYVTRYQVSLIQNGLAIKTRGTAAFLETAKEEWTCPQCGGIFSLHDKECSDCKVKK